MVDGVTNSPPPPANNTQANAPDTSGLEQIFADAAAAREAFTRISVEGNTKIAEFNEKPKI